MIIAIKPIYGNGWTDGVATIDEPAPFEVAGSQAPGGKFQGLVITTQHMLSGRHFEASPRRAGDTSTFNCRIDAAGDARHMTEGRTLYGYCLISKISE
jgi:hypothetical protein